MAGRTTRLCTNHGFKMVTNACQPPMETYLKIAKLLEVEIDELLNKKYVASI